MSGDKIVRERIIFYDYSGSGFDPGIFEAGEFNNAIWASEASWAEARVRYWCRKFYTETRVGELMALRIDEPGALYHFAVHFAHTW